MSAGLASLHKILKDETRRKALLLLREKGALSYTDLMNELGVGSTGTLNYHLKVLGNLLTKNAEGQYVLTEKGRVASQLLLEFPEQGTQEQTKKKWWRRFWVAAIVLQLAGLAVVFVLYFLGTLNFSFMVQGLFAFIFGIAFIYFFYRMIRPPNGGSNQTNQNRTVEDVVVSGRTVDEVREAILLWMSEEGIAIEVEREGFIRGRLGIPSGLGLTAPKYFEVGFKAGQNGVVVHTEGWISVFDVSEKSFSQTALVSGGIPRRKGWKVMEHLWTRLKEMSK